MFVVVTDIKQNAQTNLSRHVPVPWDMIITKPFVHLCSCFNFSNEVRSKSSPTKFIPLVNDAAS